MEFVLGFVFAIMTMFGLFAFRMGTRRRWHRRHGGGRRGHRFGGLERMGAEMVKRRLDLDEEQADLLDHVMADVRRVRRDVRDAVRDGREELADILRRDVIDDAALEVVLDRLGEDVVRARRQVVSAVKQLHGVLDAEQRDRAADWLARDDRPTTLR